jgi:1-acyl-sn-glycerol-3-phosphate acyltransferase
LIAARGQGLPTLGDGHYIKSVSNIVMLVCLAALLLIWDVFLKATSAVLRPAARSFLSARVSFMAARLLRIARVYGGLRVELDPRLSGDLPNPCLVCANHQSVADIAVLLAAFRGHSLRFVAKQELTRGFPAVSEVLRIQRHALINREGGYRTTARALATLGNRARTGISPVVFPEGTRSASGELREFYTGGIRSILSVTPLPVVGVAIDGGHLFARVSNLVGGLHGIVYRVALVGIFKPQSLKSSIRDATSAVHNSINEQLISWRTSDKVET